MTTETELEHRLRRLIRAMGPIDLATFMALALADPKDGYYAAKVAIGPEGDFVTAPEVSQIFGELLGLALADAWQAAGSPPVDLVELGPGNGTLLADLWRATARVPGFHLASRVQLVETSPKLEALQAARLAGIPDITWHADLAGLPDDRPLLLVANELFDALPIRQLIRLADGWREVKVDLDETDRLCLAPAPGPSPLGSRLGHGHPLGSVVELSPAREALMAELALRLEGQDGLAYVIDYGELSPTPGSTLQAVSSHEKTAPLTRPGEVDLTSRVAFAPLIEVARRSGVEVFGPLPQGAFIERLGGKVRLEQLSRGAEPEVAARLEAGYRRMTEPDAMGELFKVVAFSTFAGPPPGFSIEERVA